MLNADSNFVSGAPWEPAEGWLGVRLSVTTSSSSIHMAGSGPMIVLSNSGTVAACVAVGGSGVVATTNHMEVLPGTQIIVLMTNLADAYAAAITVSGTTSLQITRGTTGT